MRADLNALLYLETRQLLNRLRRIAQHPARALVYVMVIAYFAFVTAVRSHSRQGMPLSTLAEPQASAVFFAYVVLLGVLAYGAASGIAGAFSSNADARFLTGSKLSERAVVVWLQLRRSAVTIARVIFTALLYMLTFAGSGTAAGIGFAMVGAALVATALAVPMLKVRAAIGARTAQSIAGALAAIGLLPMSILLASLVSPGFGPAARGIERLGGGSAVNALIGGNSAALAALFCFAAALVALSLATSNDLLPELYGASLRVLTYQARMRRGGTAAFSPGYTYERRPARAPSPLFDALGGPWTIAWKEWIAFTRSPSIQRLFALGLVACAAAGAIFGTVVAGSRDPLVAWLGFTSVAVPLTVIFIAIGSAVGLANDLAKPLWWIGPDPLWIRLFAWIAGTSWRLAACLAAGIVALSIPLRAPLIALAGVPIAAVVVLHLRSVGLLLYALFPASIDQRGPLAMVRALLTYLFAMPPAAAAVLGAVFSRNAALGITIGILVSLLESGAFLALSSARIAGHGVAFAHAETS